MRKRRPSVSLLTSRALEAFRWYVGGGEDEDGDGSVASGNGIIDAF